MTTAFKAVQKLGKRYFSFGPPLRGLTLQYRIGETTFPKIGKILVFDSAEHALEFCSEFLYSYSATVILEGTVPALHEPPPWRIQTIFGRRRHMSVVAQFWRPKPIGYQWSSSTRVLYDSWPEGTKAANSFTPVREMEICATVEK